MPIYVHVVDHPDGRVLVDTGMTELHPALADMDPRLRPLSKQDVDLAGIDIVVNTHLHGDHCGGNHLFAGSPIYVQRRELDDARSEDDYTTIALFAKLCRRNLKSRPWMRISAAFPRTLHVGGPSLRQGGRPDPSNRHWNGNE
jgi:glyoxylase-like metal-dependent hydrolase (beta-lactamase superfamily II)